MTQCQRSVSEHFGRASGVQRGLETGTVGETVDLEWDMSEGKARYLFHRRRNIEMESIDFISIEGINKNGLFVT